MKPIIDQLKQVGANQTTVNLFLVYFMTFMFIIGVGLLFIGGFDEVIRNETPPAWVVGSFSTVIGIIGILFGVSHITNQVNNVQTRTVAEQQTITKPIVDSQAQISSINAQTIQQVLAAMATLNQSNANATNGGAQSVAPAIQANTEAVQENTQETQKNTIVEKEHQTHG